MTSPRESGIHRKTQVALGLAPPAPQLSATLTAILSPLQGVRSPWRGFPMPRFQRHIFTCINERSADSPRGCCVAKGGKEVAEALKAKIHQAGLRRIVRANKAGGLDQCSHGTTLVVYPEGVWYGGVGVEDVDEIIRRHIVGGEVVERLVIPDEDLTGRPWPGKAQGGERVEPKPLVLDGLVAPNDQELE